MDNTFDSLYFKDDTTLVAGLDESGVSDIAGPLVAACVILPRVLDDVRIFEVNDCKKIPERFRENYASIIWQSATAIGIGEVRADEIDYIGKRRAIILAMMRAITVCQNTNRSSICPQVLLIDGEVSLPVRLEQHCIKDGDLKSLAIASASIIAKVHRDSIMQELHRITPFYGWNKNKGAPCENQYKGIDKRGIQIGVHRTRYYPFVPNPNRDKRKDEGYWDWRRGLWRAQTADKLIDELGGELWIALDRKELPLSPKKPSEKS